MFLYKYLSSLILVKETSFLTDASNNKVQLEFKGKSPAAVTAMRKTQNLPKRNPGSHPNIAT